MRVGTGGGLGAAGSATAGPAQTMTQTVPQARPKTVLLTLGRLPKGLDIARALHSAGCRVIVAEPFGWHLCRPSSAVDKSYRVVAPVDDEQRYLEDLLQIVERERVGLIVPVSEEAMYAAAIQPRLPDNVQFFGPDLATLRSLHNKHAFVEQASRYGLAVPETHPLGSEAGATLAASQDVIVKPVFSSAGMGISRIAKGQPLPAVGPAPAIVQAALPGQARSSFSIARDGRVLASVLYEGTVMSGTVAVGFRRIEAPDLDAWIESFVAQSGHTGFISFDFIDDAEGRAAAIECNPRANSGIHYLTPEAIAAALLNGETVADTLRPTSLMQQFYPCLTEVQGRLFQTEARRKNAPYLFKSKDVTWDRRDPWPFLLMTPMSGEILRRALFKGMSFGEAAVADIEWRGD